MIRKYEKIWHELSIAFKSNRNWVESLECLRPVLSIHINLKQFAHVKVCLGYVYFLGIMLILDGKIKTLDQNEKQASTNNLQKLFLDILNHTELLVGADSQDSEILIFMGFFFDLINKRPLRKEKLLMLSNYLEYKKNDHNAVDSPIFSAMELEDLMVLLVIN
jgi:hypothetical protein